MTNPAPFPLEPIPGYRLLQRLGRGGFGEVWKAEAPGGLYKAIKIVYGDLEGDKAQQELRALNRVKSLRHPYLLSLDRVDVINGQLLIVMELADRNLADRFKECSAEGLPGIPREELLRYLEEAAEALDLMSGEYQLQHLDIKPQNLFIVHSHIKIADFGLVKDLEGREAAMTGGITPVYAAPEMFDGRVSRHSDQYGLAIVYQELLTGQRPFSGLTMQQLLRQHLDMAPDLEPLPPGDRPAIAKALAKVPEQRYASCLDLVHTLRGSTTPTPLPLPTGRPSAVAATPPEEPISADLPTQQIRKPRPPAPPAPKTAPRPMPTLEGFSVRPRETVPQAATPVQPTAGVAEIHGDGVLRPALVVGLGQTGIQVLRRFRQVLGRQFGSMDAVPHLRLLGIDTDPDAMTAAGQGERGETLGLRDIVLARLNRATHYLKPREGRPSLDAWLDPRLVYRIPPRNPTTLGLRALGRLAFIDNYRALAPRLQSELQACAAPAALAVAGRHTGLGLRSNRPRVYVIAGLAGGTGGGLFLDVAYVLRHFLGQLGFASPDVVGLFLLPAAGDPPLAVGNAYAALTELNHFSSPGVTFAAQYDTRDGTLRDPEPPFRHCFLLPLPRADSKESARLVTGLASGLLYRDLLTPLGHAVEALRPAEPVSVRFGSYRFAWPGQALRKRAAQRLAQRLVDRWLGKDSTPLREAARAWVEEQWAARDFSPEWVAHQLSPVAERVLGTRADLAGGAGGEALDLAAATQELEKIHQLIGRPDADPRTSEAAPLARALDESGRMLLDDLEQQVADLGVRLMEDPRYRLAGAEEAIDLLGSRIEKDVEEAEARSREQTARATEAWGGLQTFLAHRGGPPRRRRDGGPGDGPEALRDYPAARVQALVAQRVLAVFRKLAANLPEYRREVAYCRARLEKLVPSVHEEALSSSGGGLGPGRYFLPSGFESLDQTVDAILERLTADEVLDLDRRVQAVIQREFKALAQACLKGSRVVRDVGSLVQQEIEPFVAQRLGRPDVAASYLEQQVEEAQSVEGLATAFAEAAPALKLEDRGQQPERYVLGLPDGPQADRLEELARRAVPGQDVHRVPSLENVVFYREQSLAFADLPQLGPEARRAYEQVEATEQVSPHSRTDITTWRGNIPSQPEA